MRLAISLIAYGLLLLVLPTYFSYVFDLFRTGQVLKPVIHAVVAFGIAAVVFLLGWFGLVSQVPPPSPRAAPRLEYLSKASLEDEASLRRQQKGAARNFGQNLQIIKVKFDEARYAQDRHDFDRALSLYEEITRGSDENGSFATFPSACVENNMAIAYFQKQGDREFRSSSLLIAALALEPKPPFVRALIERNIKALDRYVNP